MSTAPKVHRVISRISSRAFNSAVRPLRCRPHYQSYCPCTSAAITTRIPPAPRGQIRTYSQNLKELNEENAKEKAAHENEEPLPPTKKYTFEEIQDLASSAHPGTHIIDVRTPLEIQQTGRIPTALNVPITTSADAFFISEEEFEDRFGFERPKKDEEIVFYCKAGVRSRGAAEIARRGGWKRVGEFEGSWLEWEGKGGEIKK